MTDTRLGDLKVRDFIRAVASPKHSVPAGGSVAALTGATSAALLALVCGVLDRHRPGELGDVAQRLERLQGALLHLVDEDAEAFRSKSVERMCRTPVDIAVRCAQVVELVAEVEPHVSGSLVGDINAARHLARAALDAVLDIAELNLGLLQDAVEKQRLEQEISRLRAQRDR